jgi:hypothetical protein
MKALAIVAAIVVLLVITGNGSTVSTGVHTVKSGIAKLMPHHSQGDEQDGDPNSGGEP